MKKQNGERAVLRSGSWYLCGNFLIKGITFLSVAIFTRILSVEDYGQYNTYLVYESFLTAFMGLGLASTVKLAKFSMQDQFKDYLASIAGYTVIQAILLGILCGVVGVVIKAPWEIVVVLWISAFCNCIYQIVEQRFIIESRYKAYIGAGFCFNIPQIFLSIGLIYWDPQKGLEGRLSGHVIPLIFLGIVCLVLIFRVGRPKFEFLSYSLKLGIPIIIGSLASTMLTQADRIVIEHYEGAAKVGIYTGINYIGSILYIIMLSLSNVWDPYFLERFTLHRFQEIKKALPMYVFFFMIPVIGLMGIGKEVSILFLSNDYMEGVKLLIPLCMSWFFNFLNTLLTRIQYAHGKTMYIAIGTGIGAFLNLILNVVFVPRYGYEAAAYTTVVSYVVIFLFQWIMERKQCNSGLYSIKILLGDSGIVLLAGICFYGTFSQPILRWGITMSICTVMVGILGVRLLNEKRRKEKEETIPSERRN